MTSIDTYSQGPESSGTDSPEAAEAGGHEPTHHAPHPHPVDEHFGVSSSLQPITISYMNAVPLIEPCQRGFYISIAALALSIAVYKYTTSDPDKQPLLTRVMASYNWFQDEFARRNALHTAMVEQAAEDRNLFQSSPWTHHTELKFQE